MTDIANLLIILRSLIVYRNEDIAKRLLPNPGNNTIRNP